MTRLLFGATVAALSLLASHASALTIDDFASGFLESPGLFTPGGGGSVGPTTYDATSALGGKRKIGIVANSAVIVVTVPSADEVLDIQHQGSTTGTTTVTWDNGFSVDLTADGRTGIFLGIPAAADNPSSVTFTLNETSSLTKNFPDAAFGNSFFFPFAEFSGSPILTAITSISMEVLGAADFDGQFSVVETRVPVPGSLALLGIGLAVLRVRRRSVVA
jgi:hypothetical protein